MKEKKIRQGIYLDADVHAILMELCQKRYKSTGKRMTLSDMVSECIKEHWGYILSYGSKDKE
jgi:hypothetical protein